MTSSNGAESPRVIPFNQHAQRTPRAPTTADKPLGSQQQDRKQRATILIVTHGDNFVEVFGDDSVDVHVAQAPYTGTTAGEIQAEEWLDKTLPKRFADIYLPGNRRKSFVVEPLTPQEILARQDRRTAFERLDRIANRLQQRGLVQ